MTDKISVTRALAQIKTLDARIADASSKTFVNVEVNGKSRDSQQTVQEQIVVIKSNMQSVRDMLTLRTQLKAGVIASNAVTFVSIAGKSLTVAEAIERKGSIQHEVALLNQLKNQRRAAVLVTTRINEEVKVRLDKLIETAVGKDRKVDEAEIAAITGPFVASNEAKLIDPLGIDRLIETMENEINAFVTEVDYALSEINAVTLISPLAA